MPKCHSMQSIQADLEQYARDEFPQVKGRGVVAALVKRLDIPDATIRRAHLGGLVAESMARRVRAKINPESIGCLLRGDLHCHRSKSEVLLVFGSVERHRINQIRCQNNGAFRFLLVIH